MLVKCSVQNFHILIAYAVRICKQCLQSASASAGGAPYTLASVVVPTGYFRPPGPVGYSPRPQ